MDMQPRPHTVNSAIKALYLSLLISLISGLINITKIANGSVYTDLPSNMPMHSFVLLLLAGLAFILLIQYAVIHFISRASNLARIIYLVCYLIGLVIFTTRFNEFMSAGLSYFIPAILNTLVRLFACYYMFNKEANPWFRSPKQA